MCEFTLKLGSGNGLVTKFNVLKQVKHWGWTKNTPGAETWLSETTTVAIQLFISNLVGIMAYFHCQTRIQIRTRTRIPNLMAIWYYVSIDSDSDLDPFPIVFV